MIKSFVKFLAVFAVCSTPSIVSATNLKESIEFGSGDRCSFMCDAFRDNANGMCMRQGFAGGGAGNCNCNEGGSRPNAYGDVSCSGSLSDQQYGGIMYLPLNGDRCSAMSARFEYEISRKCRERGYRNGSLRSGIQCSEANNTQWAIASVLCEGTGGPGDF